MQRICFGFAAIEWVRGPKSCLGRLKVRAWIFKAQLRPRSILRPTTDRPNRARRTQVSCDITAANLDGQHHLHRSLEFHKFKMTFLEDIEEHDLYLKDVFHTSWSLYFRVRMRSSLAGRLVSAQP